MAFLACFHKTKVLFLLSTLCFVFLFVGGPDYYSPRSYQRAWDLGHIFFFAIGTFSLIHGWEKLARNNLLKQFFWCFSFGLLFSLLTELVQAGLQRTADVGDIWRNLLGCMAALFFLSPNRKASPKIPLHFLQLFIAIMVLLEIFPLARALTDEAIAKTQFPVLADFETPFEVTRWQSRYKLTIDHTIVRHGRASLKAQLTSAIYSAIVLNHFPGDWQEFRYLNLSIFNPSSDLLQIHCRIHDARDSKNTQSSYDRFNGYYTLLPGWNDIEIPLEDIETAPNNRKMDLGDIRGIGIFILTIPWPEVIHIDDVRLVK